MTTESRASRISNIVVAICAVILTTFIVVRRDSTGKKVLPQANTIPFTAWKEVIATGQHLGPDSARIHIVEFSDLECPVCAQFTNASLRGALERYPNDIQVTFRHWPLSYHKLAYPAGRAAECAAVQGKFWEFQKLVFSQQDSLGAKSFDSFAREVGVADSTAFHMCASTNALVPAIDSGIVIANREQFRGTPTIIINGEQFTNPPDSLRLDAWIAQKLGKSP